MKKQKMIRLIFYSLLASILTTALGLLVRSEYGFYPAYSLPTIYRGFPEYFLSYWVGYTHVGSQQLIYTFYTNFSFYWVAFLEDIAFWFFVGFVLGAVVHNIALRKETSHRP